MLESDECTMFFDQRSQGQRYRKYISLFYRYNLKNNRRGYKMKVLFESKSHKT